MGTMGTVSNSYYDQSTKPYMKTQNESPMIKYVKDPSILGALESIGGIAGKEILDFGCGRGTYTSTLVQNGASLLIGIDSSTELIDLAKKEVAEKSFENVQYFVADSGSPTLDLGKKFDVIISVNVFHFANSVAQFRSFALNISSHIKSGGRILLSVVNGESETPYTWSQEAAKKYQFRLKKPNPTPRDGASCEFFTVTPEGEVSSKGTYYHYSRKLYEEVLAEEGFCDFTWKSWNVSVEGIEKFGKSFWEEFSVANPYLILTAKKL